METKPKIDFSKDAESILLDLRKRLEADNDFHTRNEIVACSILNMMLEKTLMYGGNNNSVPFKEKVLRAYYEGIGRKANRLPKIIERALNGDQSAKIELIDTIIDIAGYSILALSAFAEEIQNEQVS